MANGKNGGQLACSFYGKDGLRLIAAHVDTPHLDLKQHPLHEACEVGLMKTHYYGGIKKYQWLARPLALHGVVILKNGRTVPVCVGEDENDPVLTVLDLLPHLSRRQREETVDKAFPGEKLNVAVGHAPAETEEDGKVWPQPPSARLPSGSCLLSGHR